LPVPPAESIFGNVQGIAGFGAAVSLRAGTKGCGAGAFLCVSKRKLSAPRICNFVNLSFKLTTPKSTSVTAANDADDVKMQP